MYNLTAADFADTGQWRLLLNIGAAGLEAFLGNTVHSDLPPQPLCSVSWEKDRDALRKNIEDAVFGNPRLLDDFATNIIIYDDRTLFIPTEVAEQAAGKEEEVFNEIYSAEDADIMTDVDRDITAVWSLGPGVKSFLMRTFPGSRITCNLMHKVRNLRKGNKGVSLFAYADPLFAGGKEADVILLDDGNLISASTHEWKDTDDIAFIAWNLMDVYGYRPEEVAVSLYGIDADSEPWKFIMSKAGSFSSVPNPESSFNTL